MVKTDGNNEKARFFFKYFDEESLNQLQQNERMWYMFKNVLIWFLNIIAWSHFLMQRWLLQKVFVIYDIKADSILSIKIFYLVQDSRPVRLSKDCNYCYRVYLCAWLKWSWLYFIFSFNCFYFTIIIITTITTNTTLVNSVNVCYFYSYFKEYTHYVFKQE